MEEIFRLNQIPVLEWHLLSIDTLKGLLSEVKEAHKDKLEEMESITDKSIKILIAFVAFVSAVGLYFPQHGASSFAYIAFGVLSIINVGVLFWNIKGHHIVGSGNTPEYILTKDFDRSDLSVEIKEKLFYKNLIEQYWSSTNKMRSNNNSRVLLYDITLLLSISVAVSSSIYLGTIIYLHP